MARRIAMNRDCPDWLYMLCQFDGRSATFRFSNEETFRDAFDWLRTRQWENWGMIEGRGPSLDNRMLFTETEAVEFKVRWGSEFNTEYYS